MKKITKNIFESIEEYSNKKEIPEHLVNRIINFMKDFDLYDFRDNYETDEDAYNDIVYGTEEIVDYMKNIADDEECLPELRKEARSIFLMLTQGTDNEDLINAGRESENRILESDEITKKSDEAVKEFNDEVINESTKSKFVPKQMNDYIKSYEKKYNKPVKKSEWLGCAGNDNCGEDYIKINGKRYVFDIETKEIKESTMTEGTSSKRVAKYNEFDNGKVIHSWSDMSDEEAEEQARQASLKDDKDVYYVQYDNVMNPTSKYVWYKGERYVGSEANDIIKSMNESNDINDALADDIKKVADIEPGSDEEDALNDMSTPRYGITYDCIYRSGDLMARQFQIQSDESFSLLLKLNDEDRGTWIDVNRAEPDDWSWDFNQYIFDNNNSIDEEAKKMQELISTNYAEDVLQIIYEFARDYKLDKDDLEESDNSYWSSVPNEELMRIVSNLLSEYKGSKISKMINRVEGKINLLDLANKLEVEWEILLRTLEYMCSKGLAKEIDDSTYLILDSMKEYEELDTNNYKKFNHVNDVWNYLEASTSEEDLADRISEINPKEFGSVYYEKHKDDNGATVIMDYQDDNEDYYEKVDVYFDKEELDESVDNKEFELIEATDEDLNKLYDGSALTFEGLASDEDSLKAMIDFFKENTKITIPAKVYHLTGAKMNSMYGLTGSNAYPDDLNIISLPLDNWKEMGNLPIIKLRIGARWFDDIVDNNRRRQESMNESIDEINNIEDNIENAEVIKSKIEFDGEEPYFEKDGRKYYLSDYTFDRDNSIITLDDGMYKIDIEYGIDDYIVLRKMED